MNISRIFTLCIAYTLLSTPLCHAFWPLPTSRDVVVAGSAAIGTVALLHSYYRGQERRITAAIHTENDATRSVVVQQNQETQNVMREAGQEVVQSIQETRNALQGQLSSIDSSAHTLLLQNCGLAELMMMMIQRQDTLQKNLCGSNELLALPAPSRRVQSVMLFLFAAKFPTKSFLVPEQIHLFLQSSINSKPHEPAMPSYATTIKAHGSLQELSFKDHVENGLSRVGKFLWKGDYAEAQN